MPRQSSLIGRGLWAGLALSVAAGLITFACASRPESAISDEGGTVDPSCSGEGCPCAPDTKVACGVTFSGDQNFLYCYEGQRKCVNGVLGACAEGSIVPKSRALLETQAAAFASGLHTRALGTSALCTTVDAGDGGIDPCDPNCSIVVDTAAGLVIPGFLAVDGGGITPGALGEVCGNGTKGGAEQCDDGNVTSGDGCSSTCKIEKNFKCPTPGSACVGIVCGDGNVEGIEQCDDGNNRPYDGCSPTCEKDFSCPVGAACNAVCGDGLKFPSEGCDDGNTTDGDGCSSTCTVEPGANCNTVTAPRPLFIDVPILYRDFTPSHPDFEWTNASNAMPHTGPPFCGGATTGIPAITLFTDGRPVAATPKNNCISTAASFSQWYRDDPSNVPVLGRSLRLRAASVGAP